jgi:hypothetical protein
MSDKLSLIKDDESLKKYQNSDYLGCYSIKKGTEPVLTMDSFWQGDLTLGGGRKEKHPVVKFKETSVPGIEEVKPMIVNATNRKTLIRMYGGDTPAHLKGKQVKLYIDPSVRNPDGGGITDGLRFRGAIPARATATQPAQQITCSDCKKQIQAHEGVPADKLAGATSKKYGRALCYDCALIEKGKAETATDSFADQMALDETPLPFDNELGGQP